MLAFLLDSSSHSFSQKHPLFQLSHSPCLQRHPSPQSTLKTSSHLSTPSSTTTLLQLQFASNSSTHSCFSSFYQASFNLHTGFLSLCTPSMPSPEGEYSFLRMLKRSELTGCAGSDQLLVNLFFWRVSERRLLRDVMESSRRFLKNGMCGVP